MALFVGGNLMLQKLGLILQGEESSGQMWGEDCEKGRGPPKESRNEWDSSVCWGL